MNDVQRQIYFQAHMLDECFIGESIFDNKKYDSLQELEFYMDLYPTHKKEIIQKAGKKFDFHGEDAWFIVAEDGHFIAFDEECNEVEVAAITEPMISKDIKKIIIPDSVTSIGNYAFAECRSLESIIIPDSVESIEDSAFAWCTSLKLIIIPNSMTSIGEYAFYSCESLESITIPNSVKSIGNWAFAECRSLESIIIPDSVTSIGDNAFRYCTSLKEVVFKGKTFDEVQAMEDYPFGIKDESIIKCEA